MILSRQLPRHPSSHGHEHDPAIQASRDRLKRSEGRVRPTPLYVRNFALVNPALVRQLLLGEALRLARRCHFFREPKIGAESLQLLDCLRPFSLCLIFNFAHEFIERFVLAHAKRIWVKTYHVKRVILGLLFSRLIRPMSRLPRLQPQPRDSDLFLLLPRRGAFAFVVATEEQDDPVTMGVTKDAQ